MRLGYKQTARIKTPFGPWIGDIYSIDVEGGKATLARLERAGSPLLVHAIAPRVAVMNNGPRKGASPEAFRTIEGLPPLEDLWQLHYSVARPAIPAANSNEPSPT